MSANVAPAGSSPAVRAFYAAIADMESGADTFVNNFTADFKWVALPTSLGLGTRSREELAGLLAARKATFEKPITMTVHKVFETTEAVPTVIAQAESNGKSAAGTVWHNEYVFIAEFEPIEGDALPKITKLTEFMDGVSVLAFRKKEAEAKSA
ncbi:hypothetical protein CYLTODRAFT_490452 [Cylindrobasidium torrendii FP15055 ss-10]|uniref:SnoaL-like domain-containing protein n=1 Tax=Cylindrobasidium torrendii FP15055 ss-10 TaxID=1314674 RepID=A0A0D7BDG5_9AGAR|nr:hypothetical protein CYLTODRAFT_490452 [Cylindrobasidium torrendii FP15055 ss-10]